MAVEPRRGEITRETVQKWIDNYGKSNKQTTLEAFIRDKVDKLQLKDRNISTTGHEDLPDETDIADLIIADLPSYA